MNPFRLSRSHETTFMRAALMKAPDCVSNRNTASSFHESEAAEMGSPIKAATVDGPS